MRPEALALIVKKRDGFECSAEEVGGLISGYLAGEVPDYQMSAWLMAACLRGLGARETLALTSAMLHSGRVLDLPTVGRPKIDKHSTGGVGDKISLCLGPAVAAAGVAVPMVCGRGLGHTGGTVDKLESIPGYRTALDAREFEDVVAKVGVSMIGQTSEIAPADAKIYSLRDVTGTVESIPLIVASIMSKKLAEGADGLLFDVKVGCGAFMKSVASARTLADALLSVGAAHGKRTSAILTDMSSPIGRTIGNALEVREAIDVLRGEGPPDTVELTVALGAEMLELGGVGESHAARVARIAATLHDGSALAVFRRMVEAHGGDPRVADDPRWLPRAPERIPVLAESSGYVQVVDAAALAALGVELGAGRTRVGQAIDPAVGIELAASPGDRVSAGEPLAWLHVHDRFIDVERLDTARGAFAITMNRTPRPPRILEHRSPSAAAPKLQPGRVTA